jgi:hypothetical protein
MASPGRCSRGAGAWFGLAGARDAVADRFGDAVVSGVALPRRQRDWGDRSGSDDVGPRWPPTLPALGICLETSLCGDGAATSGGALSSAVFS